MKHNLIADIVKPWWFLKIVWADFLVEQFALFYVRIVKRTKSDTITCKLCAWVIFIKWSCLLDYCVITRIPSRTNQERGKLQHFLVETMWPEEEWTSSHNALRFKLVYQHFPDCISHADWLFTVTIVTWKYEDLFSFVISASSEGSFLLRINNS